MNFYDYLIKRMHKVYKNCAFIKAFFTAFTGQVEKINTVIERIFNLLFFDKLDENGCQYWEERLNIKEFAANINDRRANIRARWNLGQKVNLTAIQNVCDSWENGKISAEFEDGVIDIRFISEYGIPESLNSLEILINDIKPAHLGYKLSFKYLLIEDIHEIKTLEEMENITIDDFAFGIEE